MAESKSHPTVRPTANRPDVNRPGSLDSPRYLDDMLQRLDHLAGLTASEAPSCQDARQATAAQDRASVERRLADLREDAGASVNPAAERVANRASWALLVCFLTSLGSVGLLLGATSISSAQFVGGAILSGAAALGTFWFFGQCGRLARILDPV